MASLRPAPQLLPSPFIGRQKEVAALRECIAASPVTILSGGAGIGKSELIGSMIGAYPVRHVRLAVAPGQSAEAVLSRVCRHVGAGRYGMSTLLQSEEILIVIDAAHRLAGSALGHLLELLGPDPTWLGRVVIVTRSTDGLINLPRFIATLALDPMSRDEAQALWEAWRQRGGFAGDHSHTFSAAFAIALGIPERLRAAFSELVAGSGLRALPELPAPEKMVLATLALWREPIAVSALSALVSPLGGFDILCNLEQKQWISVAPDGCVSLSETCGGKILHAFATDLLDACTRRIVDLLEPADTGPSCAPFDAIERLRERTMLRLGLGDIEGAVDDVTREAQAVLSLGASVELEEMISTIGQAHDPVLRATRLELAVREGRMGEAAAMLELLGDASQIAVPLRAAVWIARGQLQAAYRLIEAEWRQAAWRRTPDGARAWRLLRRLGRLGLPIDLPAPSAPPPLIAAIMELTDAEDCMALGDFTAARQHVTRARSARAVTAGPGYDGGSLGFELDCLYTRCLIGEGLLLEAAEETARLDGDPTLVHFGDARLAVLSLRALLARSRGDTDAAIGLLREVSRIRRRNGDELGAMLADGELADTYLLRGELILAVELGRSLGMRQSGELGATCEAMANSIIGRVLRHEWRLGEAHARLQAALSSGVLPYGMRRRTERWLADTSARISGALTAASPRDDIADWLARADHLMALGNLSAAFSLASQAGAEAERRGAKALCAKAFALLGRILFLRADTVAAEAAASRAVREAAATGVVHARCHGLFVLASTRRDAGDTKTALTYARDAYELASNVGLVVERLIGHAAYESLAGGPVGANPEATLAMTMSDEALAAARSFAAQLGLGRQNAVEITNARGERTHLAAAGPDMLRYGERMLVVDGTRDEVWINGELTADLRRRSLLKRLLFLFCEKPGNPISKEEIVRYVWEVEYHPLRHDAAIFTNIMRLRKLLGDAGPKWLRGDETGYTFTPPDDYLFVSKGG